MRTIETTVYTFDELNDRAKDSAREWFRSGNDDWASFTGKDVADDCIDALEHLGFIIDRKHGVSWSGFSSQGDGASFAGTWYYAPKATAWVADDRPTDTDLRDIAEGFDAIRANYDDTLAASLTRRSSRYCHEMTVAINVELDSETFDAIAPEDSDALAELCRDAMRWIYRQLESAYNWETADEQVDESIRANAYEFTESGERA